MLAKIYITFLGILKILQNVLAYESPREGEEPGDSKIPNMWSLFVMDLCQAFLNTQKRDSLHIFL